MRLALTECPVQKPALIPCWHFLPTLLGLGVSPQFWVPGLVEADLQEGDECRRSGHEETQTSALWFLCGSPWESQLKREGPGWLSCISPGSPHLQP